MTSRGEPQVLLIDDDPTEATRIAAALTAAGYGVTIHADALSGLIDGEAVLFALRTGLDHPPPVVALIDGTRDPESVRGAGARAVLRQPPESATVLRTVNAILTGEMTDEPR